MAKFHSWVLCTFAQVRRLTCALSSRFLGSTWLGQERLQVQLEDGMINPVHPSIFISYSRSDGDAFAKAFERRLENQAGIRSWRDLKSMGSGDIRPQVLLAIENVNHLVLILSRRAITSDWVKLEWTHARMLGRIVSPVLADSTLKRTELPSWIRREEVYNIADPERWKKLVEVLGGPGYVRRVPYMEGDLTKDFVRRSAEYTRLREAVLSASADKPVVLRGAGGYGKTMLANYLCRDPDIRFEFTDGILRVELGKERYDMTSLVIDLIETLDPQRTRPGFQDVQTAAERLGELIGEARLLLVIDDVWSEAQLHPFLRGGPNCVRLVSTRLPQVLPAAHIPISIDEMSTDEALSLISTNLHGADNPVARMQLAALAKRLGRWAQMLSIANGWMRDRIAKEEMLDDAIMRFDRRLSVYGLTGFEAEDERLRDRAIRACVEASLEDLKEQDLDRLTELAILPEDESVPLDIIEALWSETGCLDAEKTDQLVGLFYGLSLLQGLNLGARTLRMHDNLIWYLRNRIKAKRAENYLATHAAMVRAIRARCEGNWETLLPSDTYAWRFLIRHLREAGQTAEADRLLSDYSWIKAKLHASGPQELFGSYIPETEDEGVRLIGRAIGLSQPALAANPKHLPHQLFGRLGGLSHRSAIKIASTARADLDFHPAPRWPGLTPPGHERLRLTGHESSIGNASFSPDGKRILTSSGDGTARIWDGITGAELIVARGHTASLTTAAFSPDGASFVTASEDQTVRIWDATTGREIRVLHKDEKDDRQNFLAAIFPWPDLGHESPAAYSSDGRRIVFIGPHWKNTQVWDAITGAKIVLERQNDCLYDHGAGFSCGSTNAKSFLVSKLSYPAAARAEIFVLPKHKRNVYGAAFSADGALFVSASDDQTARVRDSATDNDIAALRHDRMKWQEEGVTSASFSPDGARILTTGHDRTVRIWKAQTWTQISILRGHDHCVNNASFSPEGDQIVSASRDCTARVWDTVTETQVAAPGGHDSPVLTVTHSFDGAQIVSGSADHTARIWNAITGAETFTLRGHTDSVTVAMFSPDDAFILTAAGAYPGGKTTVRFWNSSTGEEVGVPRELSRYCGGATFLPDGRALIMTFSGPGGDGEAFIWDAQTGHQITVLIGHSSLVSRASFSPDSAFVVTASLDNTARVWDVITGREIAVFSGHDGKAAAGSGYDDGVTDGSFSPDGARVVTIATDRTARVWDAMTGAEFAVLRGHYNEISTACFSPDGNRVITASLDRTARLWDAMTGAEIVVLRGHYDGISTACFSPDGNVLITASLDRTARLWDVITGRELACIALDAVVSAVNVFGGTIALGDGLGRIHVFDAEKFLNSEILNG